MSVKPSHGCAKKLDVYHLREKGLILTHDFGVFGPMWRGREVAGSWVRHMASSHRVERWTLVLSSLSALHSQDPSPWHGAAHIYGGCSHFVLL